jgi:hypothetical protein
VREREREREREILHPFSACMGPNFSEELYVKIPHTLRDQIPTENVFVSPHTLKKLICKCVHCLKFIY